MSAPKARHVTPNFNTPLRSHTPIDKTRDSTPIRFNYPIRLSAEYPPLYPPPSPPSLLLLLSEIRIVEVAQDSKPIDQITLLG